MPILQKFEAGKCVDKGAKMALNRSPVFTSAILQIVCAVEIQFESAWPLNQSNIGHYLPCQISCV